jgi:hypothetical protein
VAEWLGQSFGPLAPDDHVFIADRSNNRVQVLTPALDFYAFVGVGLLSCPVGVCADDDAQP